MSLFRIALLYQKSKKYLQAIELYKRLIPNNSLERALDEQLVPNYSYKIYYNIACCYIDVGLTLNSKKSLDDRVVLSDDDIVLKYLVRARDLCRKQMRMEGLENSTSLSNEYKQHFNDILILLSGIFIKCKLPRESVSASLELLQVSSKSLVVPSVVHDNMKDEEIIQYVENIMCNSLENVVKIPPECIFNLNIALRQLNMINIGIRFSWYNCQLSYPVSFNNSITIHNDNAISYSVLFVCVKWGTKYNSAYVNNLYKGIKKYYTDSKISFLCFTDNSTGLDSNITCINLFSHVNKNLDTDECNPLAIQLTGWWTKAWLFSMDAMELMEQYISGCGISSPAIILYIDLDTIICQSLNPFIHSMHTCIMQNHTCLITIAASSLITEGRTQGINTSVMAWVLGQHRILYDYLCRPVHQGDGEMSNNKNEKKESSSVYSLLQKSIYKLDHYIEMMYLLDITHPLVYIQDIYPNALIDYSSILVSLGKGCNWKESDKDICMIIFPLYPKPHHIIEYIHHPDHADRGRYEWILEYWVEDGIQDKEN